jgi:hypothetical protein
MVNVPPVLTMTTIGKIQEGVRYPVAVDLKPRSIMVQITVTGIANRAHARLLAPVHLAILMQVPAMRGIM